jgi:alkanesulfonate monooxygenase SsuD/methylene tetrahydromethanopterin reductase-like flavin-dependent oxidoreductase (luciferase family)
MRVYHFTEQPYPNAWLPEHKSLRVVLPNSHNDPRITADLYHRYLDEWLLADELGFDLMVNEHHATATCLTPVAGIVLAILARQTKRARILTLGYPIANRLDPVRMAEEFAMIDVISRGRLDIGLVRGVPYEVPLSQRGGVGMMDRFWEAHDLILKAMTTHDGPFDWQGENFQYRNINVWPRVYQDPHPPIWITGRSPQNIREIAEKGYVLGTFLSGFQTRELFDHYRKACADLGRPQPGPDRFAYLGIVAVAQTKKEAMRRAEIMSAYLRTSALVSEPFKSPPGYFSVGDTARMLRAGRKQAAQTKQGQAVDAYQGSIEDLIAAGVMFVGTPDDVYQQLADFNDGVGGLGNFLMMGQAGHLSHEDTVDNLTLFAKEVMPRLKQHAAKSQAARAA